MAPVIQALRAPNARFQVEVVKTGQHRDLLDRALGDFDLTADHDLEVSMPGQSLAELTGRAIEATGAWLNHHPSDLVIAQGDTISVLAAALAGRMLNVPFAHIEAGLRSGDFEAPFPEELNRVLTARLAALHFAPTETARRHLIAEGVAPETIHLVGNTVVDALQAMIERSPAFPIRIPTSRYVLLTTHRRENWGEPLRRIASAARWLLERFEDLSVVFPIHPNPLVRGPALEELGGLERAILTEPLGYPAFVALMNQAALILSDSGGVQEEAPVLGVPVLVLRDATERPEAIELRLNRLVGTDPDRIVAEASALLKAQDRAASTSARCSSPYGDGRAAERIATVLEAWFEARETGNESEAGLGNAGRSQRFDPGHGRVRGPRRVRASEPVHP